MDTIQLDLVIMVEHHPSIPNPLYIPVFVYNDPIFHRNTLQSYLSILTLRT